MNKKVALHFKGSRGIKSFILSWYSEQIKNGNLLLSRDFEMCTFENAITKELDKQGKH